MKDKTVNLNLADIWNASLNKACNLLEKDIQIISGKKIRIYFHTSAEVADQGKVIGFQSDIFIKGELGCIVITADDKENHQYVIIKIGTFHPNKMNGARSFPGYTEKAAVFFQETNVQDALSLKVSHEALWVNLESFPSQEFSKHCVNWIFHDVHPVVPAEKRKTEKTT